MRLRGIGLVVVAVEEGSVADADGEVDNIAVEEAKTLEVRWGRLRCKGVAEYYSQAVMSFIYEKQNIVAAYVCAIVFSWTLVVMVLKEAVM